MITEAPLDRADAILVLGGSGSYRERARKAAQLLSQGRAPRILVTNDNMRGPWSKEAQRNLYFYERALEELKNRGVRAESIEVLPEPVGGTHNEAELVKRYAIEHGLHSVLVVTSAYHSRRALWTFTRVFRDTDVVIGMAPVAPGDESPAPVSWWLSRRGWSLVAAEYVKLIYYVVKYR